MAKVAKCMWPGNDIPTFCGNATNFKKYLMSNLVTDLTNTELRNGYNP